MSLTEKQIENNILCFLSEIGIYAWKNQSVGIYDPKRKCYRKSNNRFHINGVSDILGVLPDGSLLAVEVKSKTGRPSDDQRKFIRTVLDNSGVAFFSRSVMQTFDQLRNFIPNSDKFIHIARKYEKLEALDG